MTLAFDPLQQDYDALRRQAHALAGHTGDLAQRASVYFQLYQDSGGRNAFPLIAAHGALWASGHFRKGLWLGRLLALRYAHRPHQMREKFAALQAFAEVFRDINRRVCAEVYCAYHFSKRHGHTQLARQRIPARLLYALNMCHAGQIDSAGARRELFEAFFLWEQEFIVSPAVEQALAAFDWPLVKGLAMRPRIEFAYFRPGAGLQFRDFSSRPERIEQGLRAFEIAELVGYDAVARSLRDHPTMPPAFRADPRGHFLSVYDASAPGLAQNPAARTVGIQSSSAP